MSYTINANAEFNSLEISFDAKPSEAVRSTLKALRFRWHVQKKVWYGKADETTIRSALDAAGQQQADAPADTTSGNHSTPAVPRPGRVDRDMLRAQYALVWGKGSHMADYCVNRVAAVAELPCGWIIPVDKRSIETRFCFGESGYDYDDALKSAQHARTSADYFKRENMKDFVDEIGSITEVMEPDARRLMIIYTDGTYTDQPAECMIHDYATVRTTEILDAFGGSANLDEVTAAGTVFTLYGRNARLATRDEAQIILDAWRAAAQAHEKKVDAYLKRYGTSKVHAWTYWRDA